MKQLFTIKIYTYHLIIQEFVMSVLIETSFGDITIDLNTESCPEAAFNFLKLCKIKHYNNSLFIKVEKNYVAQIMTKKPTTIWKELKLPNKNNNELYFKDELDVQSKIKQMGLVLTSNTAPHLNNSEFCITLTKAHLPSLDGKHTVFGKVQEGIEILKKINETIVDTESRPQMNIRILHTHILYDPFSDPQEMKEVQSPQMIRNSDRLEAIEHLEMLEKYEGQKDIIQATKKQKAKKQAVTLQMLGDLPDANMKPPQNILFICKLNPITQERDLQVIFSRFGPIKTVEIVRDWKTGQSLQYGFIEFQSERSCEEAYLKMDNVLIDQRRIHVDFSQSVAKFKPRNRNIKTHGKVYDQSGKGRELVAKIQDDRTYYGHSKYDIISKDIKKKQRRQQDQVREVSSSLSVSSSESEKKKKKKKKEKKKKNKHEESSKKNKHRSRSRSKKGSKRKQKKQRK